MRRADLGRVLAALPRRTRRCRLRHLALLGIVCATAALVACFSLDLGARPVQAIAAWTAVGAYGLLQPVFSFRIARMLSPTDPDVRFWRTLGWMGFVLTAGAALQVVSTVAHPSAPAAVTGGPALAACLGLTTAVMVVVMLRYPLGLATGRERACFWLDLTTVVVGIAPFGWYFALSGTGAGPSVLLRDGSLGTLTGAVLLLVSGFAAIKLLLVGTAPFCRAAGGTGTLGVILLGGAIVAGPTLIADGHGNVYLALIVLGFACIALAAWAHERHVRVGSVGTAPRRRRPYSPLPYLAIAATQGLLAILLLRHEPDERLWGVLVGSIASTALVVVRQLLTFADNARLLAALRTTEGELRWQAFHDSLTGLANRALFTDRLTQEFARAHREAASVAIMLLDLDDFKPVNDRLGHHAGDLLLQEVATRLRTSLREVDSPARLGGDEFAVLFAYPHGDSVAAAAERVLAALDTPCVLLGEQVQITASIGIAIDPDGTGSPEQLLRAADTAMYAAKRRGKGGFTIHPGPLPETLNHALPPASAS